MNDPRNNPDFIRKSLSDPVGFIERFVYGIRQPDGSFKCLTTVDIERNEINRRIEWQTKEILTSIAKHDLVAVTSGRGVTKTMSDACAVLWFLYTRENSKVIIVGPKYDQMKATIWTEIGKWLQRSYLRDDLKWTAEKIYHRDAPGLWWGTILTTKQKEKIAGIHEDHVLWIIDEASDVEEDIFETIIAGMTDLENKILLTGNLTKASGFFYKVTQIENQLGYNPATGWKILRFSSEDSERKNPKWFQRMQKYPRDSDMYRVMVLGLPPKGSPKCIITLAQCEAARLRDIQHIKGEMEPLEIGLDPASEGNDLTAAAIRYGKKLLEVRVAAKMKAPETVLWTLKIAREFRRRFDYKHKIKVKTDDTAYGNAISHYLSLNCDDNIEVVPVKFGGGGNENYSDNSTIMWFHLADIIDEISLPNDDELIEELASREWIADARNSRRTKTEPKPEYKKRLGRSPDRADATILAFWDGTKKIFAQPRNEESNVTTFDIDWNLDTLMNPRFDTPMMAEVWHYCVMIINENLSFTALMGIYEYYKNKLWLYEEIYYDIPIAEYIVKRTKEVTHYDRCYVKPKVIGNQKMFRKKEDAQPFSAMLLREGLYVGEPLQYDEFGAIAQGMQMFKDNNVVIHRNLIRTRQQLNTWTVKDGKPDKEGFDCCEALMIMFSEIRQQTKQPMPQKPQHDYHPVSEPPGKQDYSTKWMTR